MLNDGRTEEWAEQVGRALVAAIPGEFGHPQFRYTFDVVNQKEINAFALPGGPMFLNRGIIEAGASEAEVEGVMGHEIKFGTIKGRLAGMSPALTAEQIAKANAAKAATPAAGRLVGDDDPGKDRSFPGAICQRRVRRHT